MKKPKTSKYVNYKIKPAVDTGLDNKPEDPLAADL